MALYLGILIAAGCAVALASGPEAYAVYMGALASPIGRLLLLGITGAVFYHLAAGVRHLVFDSGRGLNPAVANMSAVAAIAFAVVATLVVWGLAFATGAI